MPPVRRFGGFSGVFTPSLLTILGVVMYLRLGWVVGEAGLGGTLLIVLAAHTISAITGLALASLATSRTVGIGGAYFLISRAVGAPAGIAVGIPLYFAQALSVAFYLAGFSEVAVYLLPALETRSVALAGLGIIGLVAWIDTRFALRAQYLIMTAIALSLVTFFLGSGPAPTEIQWRPAAEADLREVFAVFFPAVTGIMAGVSLSGELRDPRRDLPLGTLWAIGIGLAVYLAVPVWLAMNADPHSLRQDTTVMWAIAQTPVAVTVGVMAATLSSALSSLIAAPRTLQAIALDNYAPAPFARGSGTYGEPRPGLLLTLMLAGSAALFGGLNALATLLTMFFLLTYGAINLVCALETWAANPSFRPSFQLPWWVSSAGALGCFVTMGMIHLPSMIVALLVGTLLYVHATRRSLRRTYGDHRYGIWAALIRAALYRLRATGFTPSSWRPNLIVYGDLSPRHGFLLRLAEVLVRDSGLVTLIHLVEGDMASHARARRALQTRLEHRLAVAFPALFCRVVVVDDLYRGLLTTAQSYGAGGFEANTVMLDWPAHAPRHRGWLRTLRGLLSMGLSLILVHQAQRRGTASPRSIDIWWNGCRNTGAMMLLFAHLLSAHEDARARIRLLATADGASGVARTRQALDDMLREAHLEADSDVFATTGEDADHLIRRHSEAADLLMIGVRVPGYSDRDHGFTLHYTHLLKDLPTTVLVASARSFEAGETVLEEEA